jgi:hypothetical protein
MSLTSWIDGRIKVAMDELHNDLKDDIAAMETNLTAQIISLPGLLAGQIKNVAIDAEGLAASVAGKMPPLLQNLLNPAQLAQTIAQAVLQGLPGIPGIFHLTQKRED